MKQHYNGFEYEPTNEQIIQALMKIDKRSIVLDAQEELEEIYKDYLNGYFEEQAKAEHREKISYHQEIESEKVKARFGL